LKVATSQQRWALALVRAGFRVFPCRTDEKAPATARGVHDAVQDEAAIIAHWRAHPTHNIGVACGASGLVVIDCDKPKKGWQWPSDWADIAGSLWDGTDAYAHLMEQVGEVSGLSALLSTMVVVTPSGGMHFYFQAPTAFQVRNSAGLIAPLIDVRGDGGYVLGPGSQVNGAEYLPVTDLPPAPLPEWLGYTLQAITRRRTAHHAYTPASPGFKGPVRPYAERALEDMRLAVEGERHHTFVSRIYRLALDEARGLVDLDALEPAIRDIGRAQQRTEREISQAIASGRAKAAGRT
jgi:hypothetical protein